MPTQWYCPNCVSSARTVDAKIPMHPCSGIRGLLVPLISVNESGYQKLNEREDYIGKEDVRLDSEGRPTMSVTTIRDNGEDCTVYAPTASISQEGLGR